MRKKPNYELRVFVSNIVCDNNVPIIEWKPYKVFDIQTGEKRFPFLEDEDELILREIEDIVCGYKSETHALLHVHSDLPLIKFLVEQILKYGTQNILFEYGQLGGDSPAIMEYMCNGAGNHLL